MEELTSEILLRGDIIAKGYGRGALVFIDSLQKENSLSPSRGKDIEQSRFQEACKNTESDILKRLEEVPFSETREILEAFLCIIQDPKFHEATLLAIDKDHSAEAALRVTLAALSDKFASVQDPFFCERFKDLEEIIKRIAFHLEPDPQRRSYALRQPSILVCEEPSTFLVALLDPKKLLGIIAKNGSSTSHAAIVAKARGIPFLINIDIARLQAGEALVNGDQGWIVQNAGSCLEKEFVAQETLYLQELNRLYALAKVPPETYDGFSVRLLANIDFEPDVDLIHLYGAKGVGLFRSEAIFCKYGPFPREEAQVEIYSKVVQRLQGEIFTLRTYDICPEKSFSWEEPVDSPYLTTRPFRALLQEKDRIRTQIKALLQAAFFGPVRLLLPMIADLSDIREAKAIFEEAKEELTLEKKRFNADIPIGAMIEVPSAAIIIDQIMREVDFVSIGTNDLTQYALAQQRAFSDSFLPKLTVHPSLLRLIKAVASEGAFYHVSVSLCGEMATDPCLVPLLIGLGIGEFSMAPRFIPRIKEVIRKSSLLECTALAKEALKMTTPEEIEGLLNLQR